MRHVEQAIKLLENRTCDLPIDYENLAQRVAANPSFSLALYKALKGETRILQLIAESSALSLCQEFCDES